VTPRLAGLVAVVEGAGGVDVLLGCVQDVERVESKRAAREPCDLDEESGVAGEQVRDQEHGVVAADLVLERVPVQLGQDQVELVDDLDGGLDRLLDRDAGVLAGGVSEWLQLGEPGCDCVAERVTVFVRDPDCPRRAIGDLVGRKLETVRLERLQQYALCARVFDKQSDRLVRLQVERHFHPAFIGSASTRLKTAFVSRSAVPTSRA